LRWRRRRGAAVAAAIRGALTRLPKVLAAGVVRIPKYAACWTATSAPCDAAGHHAATTPPVATATDAKAQIFSSFIQPEATVCGGDGHLQIERSGYIL
jgi:hypothetical protein